MTHARQEVLLTCFIAILLLVIIGGAGATVLFMSESGISLGPALPVAANRGLP